MAQLTVTANSTQHEVLAVKTPECSSICAGTGSKENGYDLYKAIIIMILNFFGVSWKVEQITDCAEMLYDDYYFLTLAELKHFSLRVKSGYYATSHFNPSFFNPVTLADWMGRYVDESLKIRQENALIAAMDERYNERWGTSDNRKAENHKEVSMLGQIEIIKQEIKNELNNEKRA